MPSNNEQIKKEETPTGAGKRRSEYIPLMNINAEEQVQVLLHLLMRAKESKLDILAICWEDEDTGKGSYADWFDLPSANLRDMLVELKRVVDLS